MPYYDYECTKCRRKFEIEQKISDKPRQRCPYCQGKVFRVISGGGVILKGTGFYVTDYRSPDYKKAADKDKTTPPPATNEKKKTSAGS